METIAPGDLIEEGVVLRILSHSLVPRRRSFLLVAQASAMHEHLIAPRPVRIASNPFLPYNNIRRTTPSSIRSPGAIVSMKLVPPLSQPDSVLKHSQESVDSISEELASRSPPASPRSPGPLPPETLEEFLSILRPSVMPFHSLRVYSTSPIRSSLRSHTPLASLATVTSESVSPVASPDTPFRNEHKHSNSGHDFEQMYPVWRSGGILSSPVSRTHTRNPFARRPSHENLALAMSNSTSFTQQTANGSQPEHIPHSPTQIPLPPSTSPPPFSMLQEHKDAIQQ